MLGVGCSGQMPTQSVNIWGPGYETQKSTLSLQEVTFCHFKRQVSNFGVKSLVEMTVPGCLLPPRVLAYKAKEWAHSLVAKVAARWDFFFLLLTQIQDSSLIVAEPICRLNVPKHTDAFNVHVCIQMQMNSRLCTKFDTAVAVNLWMDAVMWFALCAN